MMAAAAEAGGEEGGSGAAGEPGDRYPPAATARSSSKSAAAFLGGSGVGSLSASPVPGSQPVGSRPVPAEMSKGSPLSLQFPEGGSSTATSGGFPPLPPPPQPPLPAGGLSTVDEGDSLDGPEYEEEEVAIPLNAPPANQMGQY
ncbi:UNVERIFIED_CONTAM: hypothetical protein K2H54_059037 [Gekko kuhli]